MESQEVSSRRVRNGEADRSRTFPEWMAAAKRLSRRLPGLLESDPSRSACRPAPRAPDDRTVNCCWVGEEDQGVTLSNGMWLSSSMPGKRREGQWLSLKAAARSPPPSS